MTNPVAKRMKLNPDEEEGGINNNPQDMAMAMTMPNPSSDGAMNTDGGINAVQFKVEPNPVDVGPNTSVQDPMQSQVVGQNMSQNQPLLTTAANAPEPAAANTPSPLQASAPGSVPAPVAIQPLPEPTMYNPVHASVSVHEPVPVPLPTNINTGAVQAPVMHSVSHAHAHDPAPVITGVQDPMNMNVNMDMNVNVPMNMTDPIPVQIPTGIMNTDSEDMDLAAAAVAEVEADVEAAVAEVQQQEQAAHAQAQAAQNAAAAAAAVAQVQAAAAAARATHQPHSINGPAAEHTQSVMNVTTTASGGANVVTVVSAPPSAAEASPMPPLPVLNVPGVGAVQHPNNPVIAVANTVVGAAAPANTSPMPDTKGRKGNANRPSHTLPSTDPAYRRKDKSLGVLCSNFMKRYSKIKIEQPLSVPEVTIDEASQSLMVERRRIYDIINILEAIEVVTRKGKNTYNWHGMDNITQTLRKMQKEAFELFPDDVKANQLQKEEKDTNIPTGFAMLLASAEQVDQTVKKGKEKSLGRLSQKFIQLFLVGNETITLEEASDKILGKTELPKPAPDATAEEMQKIRNSNNKMIKTKIRRLYDIANIMASVGLIAKLHSENQHVGSAPRSRPMFKWIYPLSATEILNCIDENGIVPVQTATGETVQKQVKIGENGVVENTIPIHDTSADLMSTRAGTAAPVNKMVHISNATPAATAVSTPAPTPNPATMTAAAAAVNASLAATASAVVNAVGDQMSVANANVAHDMEADINATKAAEDAAMIANAVVNGSEGVSTGANGNGDVQAVDNTTVSTVQIPEMAVNGIQQPSNIMENVNEVAAAAAAAANVGQDADAAAATAAAVAATDAVDISSVQVGSDKEHTIAI